MRTDHAPSTQRARPTTLLLGLAAVILSGAPAGADWLVLQDGQVLETKGPWTVEGRRVTYTATNGTFSALRASLVDLEESRRLTEAGGVTEKPTDTAEPVPAKAAGLVVRQGDVRTLSTTGAGQQSVAPGPQAAPDGAIGVTQWDEEVVQQGTKLVGTLRNGTENVYLSLQLQVSLVADNGDSLATRTAELFKNWADPGEELSFEVEFSEVYAYQNVSFEIEGQPLKTTDRGSDADAETDDGTDAAQGNAEPGDDGSAGDGGPPR